MSISLVPREVFLLSPGPWAAKPPLLLLLFRPQHVLVPSCLSPSSKALKPLNEIVTSESVSKPQEHCPAGQRSPHYSKQGC